MPILDHPAAAERSSAPPPRPIYLDYHATTPTDPRVAAVVMHHLTEAFGNASSRDHAYGDEAAATVNEAREQVALLLGTRARHVVFTSGATESLNLALQGFVRAKRTRRSDPVRITLTRLEHRAVVDTCTWLAERGEATLDWLHVDHRGRLDLEDLERACGAGAELVCTMAANNEVGTIHPLDEIGRIARTHGVPVLTDATQGAGKIPILTEEWGLSMVALAAHKMYGPKGVGALVVSRDVTLDPLLRGGGHQRGLRSGTLNVPGIAGMGEAARLRRMEMGVDEPEIALRRDRLQETLIRGIPGLVVNGDTENRLAGNLHVSVPDVPNTVVVARTRDWVALATGSACSSGVETPSYVLQALGLPREVVRGALRIGIGKFTTEHEIERASEVLAREVGLARAAMRPR